MKEVCSSINNIEEPEKVHHVVKLMQLSKRKHSVVAGNH